jgi:hypothetical protein
VAGAGAEPEVHIAGWGKAIKGIKDSRKILKEHELIFRVIDINRT